MKIPLKWLLLILSAALPTAAQNQNPDAAAESSPPAVVEKGPHHRVWQKVTHHVTAQGRTHFVTSSHVELATGLHYKNELGEWIESKEEIELINGAAVARQGPHQVSFAANLNSPGAIDMLTPDGKRFRSHVLGLAYTDAASGRSVLIAEARNCVGAILPPNQVIYQDAFVGDCQADVRYTYTKAGFEQDIILLNAPPSPSEWGLNPETTRLEVFTEFIESPEAIVTSVVLKQQQDAILRQQMVEPDLIDQRLDFGVMKMENGQAFPLGQVDILDESRVDTGKSLERIDGRLFLIEKVDYSAVRSHLQRLPQAAAINRDRKVAGKPQLADILPARPNGARGQWKDKQVARASLPRQGLVLDYIALNSSLTNYTLKGDTTYHITGNILLYGTTIIEGGMVAKFDSGRSIDLWGPVSCRTAAYRPAIFTSKDDNTIGEVISGSSGSPNYVHTQVALGLHDTTTVYDLHDLRTSYAQYAFIFYGGTKGTLSHVVAGKGVRAIGWQATVALNLRNFLFHDLTWAFTVAGAATNRAEHGTFHRIGTLRSSTSGLVTLTNSLLISVTNNLVYDGTNNATNLDDSGIFQTVGGGAHYLANGSTNRNAGTNGINSDLLAALKESTTEPPQTLFNTNFSVNTSLPPIIQGDTASGDLPDLGYHYPILDFIASGATIASNVTVIATNGVNIGIEFSQAEWGFSLDDSKFISHGSPVTNNRIMRAHMVQEIATGNPSTRAMFHDNGLGGTSQVSQVRFRFTELAQLPGDGFILFTGTRLSDLEWSHSSVYSPSLVVETAGQGTLFCGITNTLWDRGGVQFGIGDTSAGTTVHLRNNLFRGVSLHFNVGDTNWTVRDNLFDSMSTNVYNYGSPVANSHNAYYQSTNSNFGGGSSNLFLANLVYEIGPLGRYYLTNNSLLINTGSVSAASAGLFHFTTATNQVKETNSMVDIGLHYLAINSGGNPIDSDGDGLLDYLEDADGDGTADATETSWITRDTDADGVSDFLELLQGRDPLHAPWADTNGLTGFRVFTPLK